MRFPPPILLAFGSAAFHFGRALGVNEARILAEVQARNARYILSDGSKRFGTPGRFETDPTADFVR
jgi:hypothetical protein